MNPDIALIEIGDDSIEKIGRWPFDRNWHGTLLNILAYYDVKAVSFDVIFSEKGEGDDVIIEASKKLDVYYPSVFDITEQRVIPSASRYAAPLLEEFSKVAKGTGHINTPPDIDGKVRRIPLQVRYKENLYPALPFALACDYLGVSKEGLKVPVDENHSLIVNYPAKWKDSYTHFSYIDIITSHYLESKGERGVVDLRSLKGKVCFIGLTATGTHDINPSPVETLYPGLGTHATAFNTLVTKSFIVRANKFINLAIAFILALLIITATFKLRPLLSLYFAASAAILFIIITFSLFAFLRIWIDMFFPIVVMSATYLYSTFHRYIAERRKRELIEKELTIAKSIQESFLPGEIPKIEGLEIEARMLTALHVGGDLYDLINCEDGTLGVMVGDVSGKGVPAALFMAKVVSEFRMFSKDKRDPAKILKDLNEQLVKTSKANLFVTMSYAFIDPKAKKLVFSSGGHLPIILIRGNEVKTLSAEEGLAMGLFESEFSDEKMDLVKGDVLVLYTDGVTEAMSPRGEEFEMERLSEIIKKNRDLTCKEIVNLIYSEVKKFSKNAPQHDDITVVAVKVLQ